MMKKYVTVVIKLIPISKDIVTASGGDNYGADPFDINSIPKF